MFKTKLLSTKVRKINCLIALISAIGCGVVANKSGSLNGSTSEVLSTNLAPGEVLFKTQSKGTVAAVAQSYKVKPIDASFGLYAIRDQKINGNEESVAKQIAVVSGVEYAEPNFIRTISGKDQKFAKVAYTTKDPLWLQMWGLKNYGQDTKRGIGGVEGADIGAVKAWEVTKGSKDIIVAVVDTGVDYTHPDLRDNIFVNLKEQAGTAGVDDDQNGYVDDIYGWNFVSDMNDAAYHGRPGSPDPMDDQGHGTHCAGTIGAVGNNGIGVTGINWSVRIMGLKFLNSEGSGKSSDMFSAILYAANNNVDVINASFGGGPASNAEKDAIKYFISKGGLFVVAAGNESNDNDANPSYPASYEIEGLIAVAATDQRDRVASFSNTGQTRVHIAAPGVGITSTISTHPSVMKEQNAEEPYATFNGTSMATPHVVGAAALVLAANTKLRKKPEALKQLLMESSDYKPNLAGMVASAGRLNVGNAVNGIRLNQVMAGSWKEEAYQVETPAYPSEQIDAAFIIKKAGAKFIQAHVMHANIDTEFDIASIFDGAFRRVGFVPAIATDHWLPPVEGDTAILNFSNAMIAIQKFKGNEKVSDPKVIPEDQRGVCAQKEGESVYECGIFEKQGKPFANFRSDAIRIDRIRFKI